MLLALFLPHTWAYEAPEPVKSPRTIPPILEAIALCESGGAQYNASGEVIRGVINPQDVGKYQINLYYHGARAQELGIDLFTEEGNTEYALLLYEEQGTTPWNWSKDCWSK